MLWVVAGCLFEVSLPMAGAPWIWDGGGPEVTLLTERDEGGGHHFRFRAEAPGGARLRFVSQAEEEHTVAVRIAPERP